MSISIKVISRNKAPSSHWKLLAALIIAAFIGFTSASLMGNEEEVTEEIPKSEWPNIAFGD